VRIDVARGARVILEDGSELKTGCRIEASAGTIRIGRGARIGLHAAVVAGASVGPGEVVEPYETRAPRRPV